MPLLTQWRRYSQKKKKIQSKEVFFFFDHIMNDFFVKKVGPQLLSSAATYKVSSAVTYKVALLL